MDRPSTKIYESTKGNRWSDFIARNKEIYQGTSLAQSVINTIQNKLVRRTKACRLSVDKIKRLSRFPRVLSLEKTFTISAKDRIFVIGCCFSRYLRSIVDKIGFDTYPKLLTLKFDKSMIAVASLPKKYSLAWYSTASIRQEFDKVFGDFKQPEDDIWVLENNEYLWERYPQFKGKTIYADPYRRNVFSIDKKILTQTIKDIDALIKEGIDKSDVFIITLGLTEVWRKKDTGGICCAIPNFFDFERQDKCQLILSDYKQNYDNLKTIAAHMKRRYPGKKIVFMVAPVSVTVTFAKKDLYLANMESKAMLMLAACDVAREFDNVYYFPSYEIFEIMYITARNKMLLFNEARRNLSIISVERILSHFLNTHCDLKEFENKSFEFNYEARE